MPHPIVESIWMLVLLLWVTGTASGLGWLLIIRQVSESEEVLMLWILSTAIGMGALSFGVLLLATCQWLTPMGLNAFWAMATVTAIAGWVHFWPRIRTDFSRRGAWSDRVLCIFSVAVMGSALLLTLTPATGNDALVYHLGVPKLYLERHGIYFIDGNIFAQYPLLPEMLYLSALHFSNDILAKLIHFDALILLVGALLACQKRFLDIDTPKWAAVAILVTVPSIFVVSHLAYSDIFFALFCFLAVLAFLRWTDTEAPAWIAIFSILVGLAMSTKFAGLILPPVVVLGVLIHAHRRRVATRAALGWLLSSSIWIVIAGAPFYVKNIWLTGNPMYPFFAGVFGTPGWSPEQALQYDAFLKYLGMGRSWMDYVALPWNVSIHAEFDSPRFDGQIGPLFLLGILASGACAVRHVRFRWAVGFMAIYFVFWATTAQQIRYLLPVVPILALCITAMVYSSRTPRWCRFVIGGLTGLAIVWNCATVSTHWMKMAPTRYLLGKEDRNTYLARHIPSYALFQQMNRKLTNADRVFLIYLKNRGFLLDRSYFSDSLFETHTLKQILARSTTPVEIATAMHSKGFTFMAIDRIYVTGALSTLSQTALDRFQAFEQKMLVEEANVADRFFLYRIRTPGSK